MANNIVQLKDYNDNNIYPIAGAAAQGSITKTMLEEGVFEGPELSEPTSVAYVATDNIQDGAVTSDKIDWQTSTTEKRIGTDYDGKPIYERTFVDTNVTFAANTSNSFSLVLGSDPLVPKKIVAAFGNVAGVQYSGGPVIQYALGAIRLASGSVTFNSNVLFSSSGSLQLSVFSQQATPGTGYYRVTVRYTR